jgi:HEAT repeat protein
MKSLLVILLAGAALAQPPRPNLTNVKFESRAFSGSLASQIQSSAPAWFGYAVKTARGDHQSCCWSGSNLCGCRLEGGSGTTINGPVSNTAISLEGTDTLAVLFRVENNQVEKVHVYSLNCPLDAGGLSFVWLTDVPGAASVSYLEKLIASSTSDRRLDGALFAISQHDVPEGLDTLIRLAKSDPSAHIRGQALFWLAQKAGQRAASTIQNAIENDPDTGVKKRAVFALSQLPKDEAVPKLIEIARNQKNREVQKQAFFWLGQTHDPRALAFFEQVLTK